MFPRFYFLSDDEVVAMLRECREPSGLVPHLYKVFEGIIPVHFFGYYYKGLTECVELIEILPGAHWNMLT